MDLGVPFAEAGLGRASGDEQGSPTRVMAICGISIDWERNMY